MKKNVFLLIACVCLVGSCTVKKPAKEYFPSWNNCEALSALQEYVADVTNPQSEHFIPVEDRIATFDMDGTFIGELDPTYFEYSLLEYRALEDSSYAAPADVQSAAMDIRSFVSNGTPLPEGFDLIHAHAAAKAYAGMTLEQFDEYVTNYANTPACGFKGMTYAKSFYQPMLEVFEFLEANDFTYYVVSGSDRFLCRALVRPLGIQPNRVIGMDVQLCTSNQGEMNALDYTMDKNEQIIRTDKLLLKNLKTNKVLQIMQEIGKKPVLTFGNSGGDCAMHNLCLSNGYHSAAFMLVADDEARDFANREKALSLADKWRKAGYYVISMRDDFKTIYGKGVEKSQP